MATSFPPARRAAVVATPNVTPMIDVMLVLLIIFMLVTPALDGAALRLPEGVHAMPRPEDVRDRTLAIDAAGAYALNGAPVARDELPDVLRRYVTAHPEDRVLYIRADQSLDYGVVRDVMQRAAESGIAVVGMVTEAPRPVGRTHTRR